MSAARNSTGAARMIGERELSGARNALERLHLGAGVRHERLYDRLGTQLRRVWLITARDVVGVMAQTIVRLEQSVAGLPDKVTVETAQAAYNLRADPALAGLNYLDRLRALSRKLGPGHAQRTLERRLVVVRRHISAQLDRDWQPIRAEAVRQVLDREREATDEHRLVAGIGELRDPRAPAKRVISGFLTSGVLVPRSVQGTFALARTAGQGDWICAFTSASRLEEYQRKANPPWSGWPISTTGEALLRELRGQRLRAGVLVNPQADRNADLAATLPLPQELVAEITGQLR
ncbi:SseB family protein [Saccharopolyspora erythraea]|uniref:SseB family protein n=1 Tax=Saccharopolyspora erythraea TaxID=1836 RepID=UPI001BAD0E4D|nr:SseB family protein [Saccharopolyspora erythraea]QUG99862.1 SseB family protein [Saccharopolyspora erythraea]